jgi:hypothetical protein
VDNEQPLLPPEPPVAVPAVAVPPVAVPPVAVPAVAVPPVAVPPVAVPAVAVPPVAVPPVAVPPVAVPPEAVQIPPWQVPILQAVPSGAAGLFVQPEKGTHASAKWHSSIGAQITSVLWLWSQLLTGPPVQLLAVRQGSS